MLCLNNMEVVGSYLASQLTKAGVISANAHKTMYITSPELNTSGQIMFRENNKHMIKGKKILILIDSVSTGSLLHSAVRTVNFYGGEIVGISAIFSLATQVGDYPIRALYSLKDLPEYMSHEPDNCPLCAANVPVDAICNGFGYSLV